MAGWGSCSLHRPPTTEQIWDWQANVNAAIGVFDNKLLAAIAHEKTDQSTVQNMLNALVAAGKQYTSVEMDYTPDMLVQDAVQAYNGYFAWQPSTNVSDYYPVNGKVTVKWVTTQYASLYEKPVLATTPDPLVATTQPPARVTAGTPFGLTVTAENADGSVNTSFNGNVTIALIDFDENSATLGGTVTVTAPNGVAAFSGLTLDQAGCSALSVSSDGMASFTTDAFDVTAMPPAELAVIGEPSGTVTAGAGFSVEVAAEDVWGNIDPTFTGSVTLALAGNPGGAGHGRDADGKPGQRHSHVFRLDDRQAGWRLQFAGHDFRLRPCDEHSDRRDACGDGLATGGDWATADRCYRRQQLRTDRMAEDGFGTLDTALAAA